MTSCAISGSLSASATSSAVPSDILLPSWPGQPYARPWGVCHMSNSLLYIVTVAIWGVVLARHHLSAGDGRARGVDRLSLPAGGVDPHGVVCHSRPAPALFAEGPPVHG